MKEYFKKYPNAVVFDGTDQNNADIDPKYTEFLNSINPSNHPLHVFDNPCVLYKVKVILDSTPYCGFQYHPNIFEALKPFGAIVKVSLVCGELSIQCPGKMGKWRTFRLNLLDEDGIAAHPDDIEYYLEENDEIDIYTKHIEGNPFQKSN